MIRTIKKILSRYTPFGDAAAEVVFASSVVAGASKNSYIQWRVKRRVDTGRVLLSIKVAPDRWVNGPDGGGGECYVEFWAKESDQLLAALESCVMALESLREEAKGPRDS